MKLTYNYWKIDKCYINFDNKTKIVSTNFLVNNLRNVMLEMDSLDIITIIKKLGRKIFVSLYNNNIKIINIGDRLELLFFNEGIFENFSLYKVDLKEFIIKYGIPIYSKNDYEKYDMFFDDIKEYEDSQSLNNLIESAITIFILDTLRVGTDKNVLPKIYKVFNTKDSKLLTQYLNKLIFSYGFHDNNENISIKAIDINSYTYNRKVISITTSAWTEYYNLAYSNFIGVKQCCVCGNFINEDEHMDYKDIHNTCLKEMKKRFTNEQEKKLKKETDAKKIEKIKKRKKELENLDNVYKTVKAREYDDRYRKKKNIT